MVITVSGKISCLECHPILMKFLTNNYLIMDSFTEINIYVYLNKLKELVIDSLL